MFFPLSDDDRHLVTPAYVTWTLLAANVLVFFYQTGNEEFTYAYAAIPYEITHGEDLVQNTPIEVAPGKFEEIPQAPGPSPIHLTLLTAMFMHGGLGHLFGNMLFLWIFGDNVEHRFGHARFLLFYLVSGLAASFAQIATDPSSMIPTLGASGAIAGVLGAYLVLFPRNRVYAVFFFQLITVPAYLVIGLWAAMQFFNSYAALMRPSVGGGVAYAAHAGGFVAGLVVALFMRTRMGSEPDTVFARAYARDPRAHRLW